MVFFQEGESKCVYEGLTAKGCGRYEISGRECVLMMFSSRYEICKRAVFLLRIADAGIRRAFRIVSLMINLSFM